MANNSYGYVRWMEQWKNHLIGDALEVERMLDHNSG
jgi:hypothetical protein